MKQFPISGFLLHGIQHGIHRTKRRESLCYRTFVFQFKFLYSKLLCKEKHFAIEGCFFGVRYHEEFFWDEVVAIRTRRAYPMGHCLGFFLQNGEHLDIYCLTKHQRDEILNLLSPLRFEKGTMLAKKSCCLAAGPSAARSCATRPSPSAS